MNLVRRIGSSVSDYISRHYEFIYVDVPPTTVGTTTGGLIYYFSHDVGLSVFGGLLLFGAVGLSASLNYTPRNQKQVKC